jgi:hypothetical protein
MVSYLSKSRPIANNRSYYHSHLKISDSYFLVVVGEEIPFGNHFIHLFEFVQLSHKSPLLSTEFSIGLAEFLKYSVKFLLLLLHFLQLLEELGVFVVCISLVHLISHHSDCEELSVEIGLCDGPKLCLVNVVS